MANAQISYSGRVGRIDYRDGASSRTSSRNLSEQLVGRLSFLELDRYARIAGCDLRGTIL